MSGAKVRETWGRSKSLVGVRVFGQWSECLVEGQSVRVKGLRVLRKVQ